MSKKLKILRDFRYLQNCRNKGFYFTYERDSIRYYRVQHSTINVGNCDLALFTSNLVRGYLVLASIIL